MFVRFCRWLEGQMFFDLLVMAMILLSLGLLVPEITLPRADPMHDVLLEIQEWMTLFFVLELVVHYAAMKKRSRFLKVYWVDLLAVVPLLRAFRLARFLRLLRLLRLFRFVSMLTNNSRIFQRLLHRRAAEYIMAGFFFLFSIMAGTCAMAFFEHPNSGLASFIESFWTTLFSLLSNQYSNDYPHTTGGRLTLALTQLCSLTFVAVITGTVSAVMIEKMREGAVLNRMLLEDLENHVLICGWNSGVEITLRQLQNDPEFVDREFVVIADRPELPDMPFLPDQSRVRLLRDDFTRVEVLVKANVATAAVALIVSDVNANRTRQDADARTVLAALTIEKLNPKAHTCAELSNGMNEHHLRMGNVNEIIITQDMAGHLLAQAARNSGNIRVLNQLLQPSTMSDVAVQAEHEGKLFQDIVGPFTQKHGAVPVAVQRTDGSVLICPALTKLEVGDRILYMGSFH